MTFYYNHEGSLIISDMVNGYYFDRVYQGYTKREAIARFKEAVKEEKLHPDYTKQKYE